METGNEARNGGRKEGRKGSLPPIPPSGRQSKPGKQDSSSGILSGCPREVPLPITTGWFPEWENGRHSKILDTGKKALLSIVWSKIYIFKIKVGAQKRQKECTKRLPGNGC